MPEAIKLPISVIIPSYNHGKFISEAIESVLTQTQVPEEVLVVDDFSKDESRKILQKFSKHVRIISHTQNLGGAATLNTGIDNTKKEFIAVLNSDDTWNKDKLEKQFSYINSEKLDVCFTKARIIDSESKSMVNPPAFFNVFNLSKPTGGNFLNHFFYRGNFLCHPSMLAKRQMFSKNGFYNSGLEQLPDFAKWIDFAKGGHIGILSEELTNYRYLPGKNASSQKIVKNQIRTRNELYLIFSSFFDGIPKNKIEELFAIEITKLDGVSQELAKIDPAVALLLNHPEPSLAEQALYAGISRIWRKSNSLSSLEQEILRSVLNNIQLNCTKISTTESLDLQPHNVDFKTLAQNVLRRLRSVK
jgi:glycosyltransferase involved in cell wall biosynthesis